MDTRTPESSQWPPPVCSTLRRCCDYMVTLQIAKLRGITASAMLGLGTGVTQLSHSTMPGSRYLQAHCRPPANDILVRGFSQVAGHVSVPLPGFLRLHRAVVLVNRRSLIPVTGTTFLASPNLSQSLARLALGSQPFTDPPKSSHCMLTRSDLCAV